ncbi:aldolase [Belnapia sp. F-4-1]|uniref:aldolase n=1 Tax=Belnapia sp. F-4-1 TaxID=1545443 RepID=UPI0005BAA03F|nr:aldolase [Belnapia sp. F-4-1]
MNSSTQKADLSALARPSGAFAMLAVDQREGLRAMMAEFQDGPVTDRQMSDFKMAALRALTPHASAALLDRELAWDRAIAERAVAPGCALIAAGDTLISGPGELVAEARIDEAVVPAKVRAEGAVAMKLLVIWRPDEPPEPRVALVDDFVARCRAAGLASIVEPVCRRRRDGQPWNTAEGILPAARELGGRGADIYKAEMPLFGKGSEAEVRRACAELTRTVQGPWVVLSSGVEPDAFPQAVEWACREGASGFLAGRAVWRMVIGRPDLDAALQQEAVPRLQRLAEVVDRALGG